MEVVPSQVECTVGRTSFQSLSVIIFRARLRVLLVSTWLRLTHLGRRPEEIHLQVALHVVLSAVFCSTILEH